MIGLGYLAARRGMVPVEAIPALNTFVFTFAMPALLVRVLADQPIETLLQPAFLMAWAGAGVVLFAATALAMRVIFGENRAGMAIAGQTATVGNIGFLGLPLVLEAFGPSAAAPFTLALSVDLVILIPVSILILETARGAGSVRIGTLIKGMILNPFLLSICVGLGIALSGLDLPGPVDRTMAFLGAAAGPAALFALGLSLADRRVEGDLGQIGLLVTLKLVVHPLLVGVLMLVLGVPAPVFAIGLALAALPVASNVFVIATRYGVRPRRTSAAILISTIIAVLTVTLAIELG